MVSIIKRLTGTTPQSERRPAACETTDRFLRNDCMQRRSSVASPKLDFVKYLAYKNSIRNNMRDADDAAMRNNTSEGARQAMPFNASSLASRWLYQSMCNKSRLPGTSDAATAEPNPLNAIVNHPTSVFEDSGSRSGARQDTILLRRSSCGARLTMPPITDSHHRRLSSREVTMNQPINLSKLLGAGGFGSVYRGVLDSHTVAVKKFHSGTRNPRACAESVRAESTARALRHPNIVRVLGLRGVDCLVMEYAGDMNLAQLLSENEQRPLADQRIAHYALDILAALSFIHANNLVHLDVKPANILVTPYDSCKLADFGCSQVLEHGTGRVSPTQRSYLTGTFAYRAPELLRGESPATSSDIYSFGITLWQMESREVPYMGQNQHVVVFGVVAYKLRPQASRMRDGEEAQGPWRAVYVRCWDADPEQRPSAHALHEDFLSCTRHACTDAYGTM